MSTHPLDIAMGILVLIGGFGFIAVVILQNRKHDRQHREYIAKLDRRFKAFRDRDPDRI